jgi:P-type conjugative transfer protein TrbJ
LLALGVAFLAAPIAPASAQIPVIDPANLAQSIIQAAHMVEQISNQVQQIRNQAQMLARNPLQLSPELSRSIDEARTLFSTAEGIAFDIRRIGADLQSLYPETWESYDLAGVLRQSDRWIAQSRTSLQTAMEMEARAAQSIGQSRERIATALGSSVGAEGQTSAIQAGNQLLGIQATQLTEIHALLIAQGRALEAERMERLAREERAGEIRRRAFPSARQPAPPPARTAF